MCYPSSGSTEWFSVGTVTSLWCSFFPNSSGFVNLRHIQITRATPNLENFVVMESELWSCSVFSVLEWIHHNSRHRGRWLRLIRNFLHSYVIFSRFKEARASSSMGKQEFPKLKRAPGIAFKGAKPEITEKQKLRSEEKSGNICCGLHW